MSLNSSKLDLAQAQLLMSQLSDGEISPANAERLNTYLEEHPEAMNWMEGLELARTAANKKQIKQDHSVAISSIQDLVESNEKKEANKVVRFPSFLRPLATAAAVAIIGGFAWMGLNSGNANNVFTPTVVEFVATDIPDASTFVYTDDESGWTVVWVEEMDPLPEEHG